MEKLLCESALEGHSSPNGTGLVKKEERVFLFVYSGLWLINKAIKTHSLKIRDKRGLGKLIPYFSPNVNCQISPPFHEPVGNTEKLELAGPSKSSNLNYLYWREWKAAIFLVC